VLHERDCSCRHLALVVMRSPCRCKTPGQGRSVLVHEPAVPDGVTEEQYAERKRVGLPPITEVERSLFKELR
jgi:hypothetical protein